jgi:ketosteroid isomerase-like protein
MSPWGDLVATAVQRMEPAEVVRAAWAHYAAGDLSGALEFFAADAVWYPVPGYPGPAAFLGREELLSWAAGIGEHFSSYRMVVTDVRDLGEFVLAHGALYAENDGEVVINRVTVWRCHVANGLITRVDAQAAA